MKIESMSKSLCNFNSDAILNELLGTFLKDIDSLHSCAAGNETQYIQVVFSCVCVCVFS